MAISVTWRNVFVLVGLAVTLLSAMLAGNGMMIQWRFNALQLQLNERMSRYEREMERIDKRLEKLER